MITKTSEKIFMACYKKHIGFNYFALNAPKFHELKITWI